MATSCERNHAVETRAVGVPGGRVWVQVHGGGDAPPLLTLHGGPGSPHDYLEPLAALDAGRAVVFYDQLGCGRSDRPDDTRLWVLDRFIEELRLVIADLDRPAVHLLGHSWGAMLAVDYALQYPGHIASLILDSPCLSMNRVREDMRRLTRELPASVLRIIEQHEAEGRTDAGAYRAASMVFYRKHVCRQAEWPEPLVRTQQAWNWDVYRTMWGPAEFTPTGNLAGYEREDRLRELRAPVLYLCGRHDEMTPESTTAFHQATPRSELVIFEQSAHVQHLEEPARYLEVVGGFLARADGMRS